jgi:hypothetical protein
LASRAKLPLPPSWPVSVEPAANPCAAGARTPAGLPPENPPPPTPWNRPFQFFIGNARKIRTLSPAGGCVTVAVTRHAGLARSVSSTAAESIAVLASETDSRLSHDRAGAALGTSGLNVSLGGAGACADSSAGSDTTTATPAKDFMERSILVSSKSADL